jgi:hypothetical protein
VPHCELGLQCGGLESRLDGDLEPSLRVELVGLACAPVQVRRVFFGVPSWAH